MDRELGRGLRSRAQERRGFSSGGAVGFCAVLYWTGRWRLLVVSLRRKVEACSLCVFLRRDGEGEVVRLDPAQHPCLITCCITYP
jgi:hypothetical protein